MVASPSYHGLGGNARVGARQVGQAVVLVGADLYAFPDAALASMYLAHPEDRPEVRGGTMIRYGSPVRPSLHRRWRLRRPWRLAFGIGGLGVLGYGLWRLSAWAMVALHLLGR